MSRGLGDVYKRQHPYRRPADRRRSARTDQREHPAEGQRHALRLHRAQQGAGPRPGHRRGNLALRSADPEPGRLQGLRPHDLPWRLLLRRRAVRQERRRRAAGRALRGRQGGRRQLSAAPVPAHRRRPPDRDQRRQRQGLRGLRGQGRGRPDGRHRSVHPGRLLLHLAGGGHPQSGDHRRPRHRQRVDQRAVRGDPRLRRARRQAGVELGQRQPGRDRAPGSRQVLYPQLAEHVVAGQRRREARPGLPAAGQPDARPVGRQPHPWRREVQRRPGGPRPEHRQAALELPVHPPRPVGHGRRQPADPARPEDRRWRQAGADRADQAGQPVRAGPPRRHADRADPRSAGAAGRGGGRPYRADPGAFRPQPAAPAADRARHVGQQPVRPDALPHPVPLAALRGPVHPAVGAGQPDLSGQRRSVQLGRGVGRPGAPDPLHQPQLHGLRLADGAARQGAQRKQARGRDQRRAAEHRRALRGDHASVHVAHRPAVPGAVLG
ncbi:hypothetical protein PAERUG_E16_London_17_VIM_2_04_14_05104 [Pseudomonas aeruginosa]|nr:hypothetical protein PAERUG_E16_London_17_VIM_2_04_14_05103 [Pseudomonas aeruginosa]CRR35354.1 hypothetical protein PAERUG_E16_London_17_VIM_2_04_14_05104 [Pseudomonas aeruginosa]